MQLFTLKPLVIVALHLPNHDPDGNPYSMAWLQDYVLQNMSVFSRAGVPAVMLQDQQPTPGRAAPETIATMAALGRIAAQEFPAVSLGIIMRANDPQAALAAAYASGASHVRLKVFIGAMLKAEGVQQGCGTEAVAYRKGIHGESIAILADVYDRTGYPILPVPIAQASQWAVRVGADGLVLTGGNYDESIHYLKTVREAGVTVPLLLGGGASEENVTEVLRYADGVIVSTALMRDSTSPNDLIQWDYDKCRRFMERATRSI